MTEIDNSKYPRESKRFKAFRHLIWHYDVIMHEYRTCGYITSDNHHGAVVDNVCIVNTNIKNKIHVMVPMMNRLREKHLHYYVKMSIKT